MDLGPDSIEYIFNGVEFYWFRESKTLYRFHGCEFNGEEVWESIAEMDEEHINAFFLEKCL